MATSEDFSFFREKMNRLILELESVTIKRFFALDSEAYRAGVLSPKQKEMMGLVASMVLRCDDCIRYHLERCLQLEVTLAELTEAFEIALIQGGGVVIPHLRRAMAVLAEKGSL
jgi:AhpD family alkylhydroperoxidase